MNSLDFFFFQFNKYDKKNVQANWKGHVKQIAIFTAVGVATRAFLVPVLGHELAMCRDLTLEH